VDWSESGDNIATASQDGTAHIWQTWTTAQRLITFAQRCCAARILTDEERLQFGLPRLPSDPAPAEIESCPSALPSRLYAGTRAEVTDQDQLALRVRIAPGLNQTIIDQIPPLQTFRVLEGPQCTDGLAWFKVIFGISATEGWVAEASNSQYFTRPVG
jgi:hypothetical protein